MADSTYEILHQHYATAAAAISAFNDKNWAYEQALHRIMVNDGSTVYYYWDSAKLATADGTYGGALIGVKGVSGVTPTGGTPGSNGTVQSMIEGMLGIGNNYFINNQTNSQTGANFNIAGMGTIGGTFIANGNSYFAGDIGLSKNGVGTTSDLSVINTGATGASSARIYTQVPSTSLDDPYFLSRIFGGVAWSFGGDNSDSDAFVISEATTLGTNNRIRIASGGAVTIPSTLGVTGRQTNAEAITFSTSVSSPPVASISKSATEGLTIRGETGSSYDFMLRSQVAGGASVLSIPTGTVDVTIHNSLIVGSKITGQLSFVLSRSDALGTLSTSAGSPTSYNVVSRLQLNHTTDPGGALSSFVTFTGGTDGQILYVRNATGTQLYITNGGSAVNPMAAGYNATLKYDSGASTWRVYSYSY